MPLAPPRPRPLPQKPSNAASGTSGGKTGNGRRQSGRHCEEHLRRSNPDYLRGDRLDCFASLAMTVE
ncbi:hypothetical protein EAS62_17640 [Bradyrhizobium zhanjiangense]|uniref:Uncharacterized protein n=1 Tax=Bradyrhizobium zhanjiangense TaxID=1325107 RepID=A0ABY0DK94_9BRAD|nr:hypothetical protein EAS62_17640 [Bradyrhizobium zhanjiangense]